VESVSRSLSVSVRVGVWVCRRGCVVWVWQCVRGSVVSKSRSLSLVRWIKNNDYTLHHVATN